MSFTIAYGDFDRSPENYYISDENPLNRVIDIALRLGKPLLLTGEPGTGKTQLAHYAAWYLAQKNEDHPVRFLDKPFVFNTKTSSAGKDLFYEYDAVSHFQDKSGEKKIAEFIHLSAMGQAIVQTSGKTKATEKHQLSGVRNIGQLDAEPRSVVVLIDEIDKATRDFPNDLLNEIETNEFYIQELNQLVKRNEDVRARILIIMTSNVEKNLPDAFLRRCIFYHIPFPSDEELVNILTRRLEPMVAGMNGSARDLEQKYRDAVAFFNRTRLSASNKKPSTSELLDWIKVLHLSDVFAADTLRFDQLPPAQAEALRLSLVTLFKNKKDLEAFLKENV